jgi:hypothetical protein
MKQVYILVEGETEEIFVKDTLAPYFEGRLIFHVRNEQGGFNRKYNKLHKKLWAVLNSSQGYRVTTLMDYYAFPKDAPGMGDRPAGAALTKALHVERAWRASYADQYWFYPFLALHETEAWLFTDPAVLPTQRGEPEKEQDMRAILRRAGSPEAINDSPETAPSKRLRDLFSHSADIAGYSKTADGPRALHAIGIPAIKAACPHFNEWIEGLEAYAVS